MRLEPQATIVRGAGAATSYRARPARARAFDGRSRACGVERPRRTGRAGACGWTWTFLFIEFSRKRRPTQRLSNTSFLASEEKGLDCGLSIFYSWMISTASAQDRRANRSHVNFLIT